MEKHQTSQPTHPPAQNSRVRRPYTKPSMIRVELRAEEAVLGACKTATTAGPAAPQCASLGGCSSIAS
ncbi:MAG: hypothetical protein ACUVR8_10665 [Acidobacteriota bacterium]